MDQKQVLQEEVSKGRKVRQLLQHPGWYEVVVPELERLKMKAIDGLLETVDHTALLAHQATARAIATLQSNLTALVTFGENAEAILADGDQDGDDEEEEEY